jgi:hypothetical protein
LDPGQAIDQPSHVVFQDCQSVFWAGVIDIVDVPVFSAVRPNGETFGEHRPMLGLLHGNDEIGG